MSICPCCGKPKKPKMVDGLGTALKPAAEFIALMRKPLIGTVAANVARHGTGAINVDGCRIPPAESDRQSYGLDGDEGSPSEGSACWGDRARVAYSRPPAGRWPANLAHDGSPEVMAAFARFGEREARHNGVTPYAYAKVKRNVFGGDERVKNTFGFGDSGTAARFFFCGKADDTDRAGSRHPTIKPVALMRWLVRLVTPPGGAVLDPFAGSGTTGEAAIAEGFRAILVEREAAYCADIRRRLGRADGRDAPLFAEVGA